MRTLSDMGDAGQAAGHTHVGRKGAQSEHGTGTRKAPAHLSSRGCLPAREALGPGGWQAVPLLFAQCQLGQRDGGCPWERSRGLGIL